MIMEETVFSVRAYFGAGGVLGLLSGVFGIIESLQDVSMIIPASISLFLGIGFLYSSFYFPELLKTSTKLVRAHRTA